MESQSQAGVPAVRGGKAESSSETRATTTRRIAPDAGTLPYAARSSVDDGLRQRRVYQRAQVPGVESDGWFHARGPGDRGGHLVAGSPRRACAGRAEAAGT